MSGDEDVELKDIAIQALEKNGVLARIRAELRASVFHVFEENEGTKTSNIFKNRALREYLHTPQGSVVTCLVREFLQFFHLEHTLGVFDQETFLNVEYSPSSRDELSKLLHLHNASEEANKCSLISALLSDSHLLDQIGNNPPTIKKTDAVEDKAPVEDEAQNGDAASDDHPTSVYNSKLSSYLYGEPRDDGVEQSSPNGNSATFKPFEESPSKSPNIFKLQLGDPQDQFNNGSPASTASESSKNGDQCAVPASPEQASIKIDEDSLVSSIQQLKLDNANPKLLSPDIIAGAPTQGSLEMLPSLDGIPDSKSSKAVFTELKDASAAIRASPTPSMENYEEDFQSSVSGSQADMKADGSISEEIEEEIPSSGATSEVTTDVSFSPHLVSKADYMEDVHHSN